MKFYNMETNNFRTSREILEDDITPHHTRIDWKKIAIPLASLVCIYILWILLLNLMVNTNSLRTAFNTSLQETIKGDGDNKPAFSISGNVSFKAFFKPYIIIDNIKSTNLIKNNYKVDFDIKQIKLNISSLRLFTGKIFVKKIEIIDGNFNVIEIENTNGINNVDNFIDLFSNKMLSKNNVELQITNSNIQIKGNTYTRELNEINLLNIFNKSRVEIFGTFITNKKPLGIDLTWQKWKKEDRLRINLFSQVFNIKTDSKYVRESKQIDGRINFDIVNLQIFAKTFFDANNFLYQRVIDNAGLNGHLTFSYINKILSINDVTFKGNNLVGTGNSIINFIENKENKFNFNIESINIDNLITKNFINKTSMDITEDNIFIFSGKNVDIEKPNEPISYLQKLFNQNKNTFNISVKNAFLNRSNLLSLTLNFSYAGNYSFNVNNISGILPGETKLLIQNNQENKTVFAISGNNLKEFWNFLNNTKYVIDQNNEKFTATGSIDIIKDKIFFNDVKFNTNSFETINTAEIALNNGISYIAVNSNITNIILDNLINTEKKESIIQYDGGSLKNKMLFLNEFSLNSFLKFNITNLKYKDLLRHNYSFIVQTSQGVLKISNINLNNEITGNVNFDIRQLTPTFNMSLNVENHVFKDGILLNKLLFDIPTFNNFNGQLSIKGKNSKYKESTLNEFSIMATLKNGVFTFDEFTVDGFGGKCNITGFLDLNLNRKINLVFNACTADLSETIYLFTNKNNISGLVGFSSVLYSNGNTLNAFLNNYIVKTQIIGSGITVNAFGLESLNASLLKLNTSPDLANSLNANTILINNNDKTIFNNLSGNIQYIGGRGQIDLDVSRPLINGKITGKFEFLKDGRYLNAYANFIMLVGTLNNTVNLTLPISINGNANTGLNATVNYQQIEDYINTIKQAQ